MSALVVTEPGARVSLNRGHFVVEKGRARLRTVRVEDTDRVLLFGVVEVTSGFIRTALSRGCDVAFFTGDGRYRGRLQGPAARNVAVRVEQIVRLRDPTFRIPLARAIVEGKLRNQRAFLLRHRRRGAGDTVARSVAVLHQTIQAVAGAKTLDAVRGFEGAGAASYFKAFAAVIRNPAFSFSGRNRRPPRDPVNACLSFGYAMLQAAVTTAVHAAALDPMVGSLHELAYGRPSLVLDLMEEWRPVIVDPVVMRLVNRRQFVHADFGPPPGPDLSAEVLAGGDPPESDTEAVYLKKTGRRILIREILGRLRETVYVPRRGGVATYQAAIEAQVYHMAHVFAGQEEGYTSFSVR